MHNEQIEAIVETALEQYLGPVETLQRIREVLRQSNLRILKPGQAAELPQNANLMESMVISHSNLARALGDAVEALQRINDRVAQLESAILPLQEAVINLQHRLRAFEDAAHGES